MGLVDGDKFRIAHIRSVGVSVEPGSGQFAVPWPFILRVGCGMNSHIAAAGLDESLKIILLFRVEDISGCIQKDDGPVAHQVIVVKLIGIGGGVDLKFVLPAHPEQSLDAGGDAFMLESGGFGEDQHADRLLLIT